MLLLAKTLRASMALGRRYNVRMFDADDILFSEIQCKKNDILMFMRRIQCALGLKQVKYARLMITHVYTCRVSRTIFEHLA